jgi:hypothetical protein
MPSLTRPAAKASPVCWITFFLCISFCRIRNSTGDRRAMRIHSYKFLIQEKLYLPEACKRPAASWCQIQIAVQFSVFSCSSELRYPPLLLQSLLRRSRPRRPLSPTHLLRLRAISSPAGPASIVKTGPRHRHPLRLRPHLLGAAFPHRSIPRPSPTPTGPSEAHPSSANQIQPATRS